MFTFWQFTNYLNFSMSSIPYNSTLKVAGDMLLGTPTLRPLLLAFRPNMKPPMDLCGVYLVMSK